MTASSPAIQRPALERLEGGPLPRRLAVVHSMLTGTWPPARRLLARLAPRLIADRLPAMIARFPDGRAFRIPAGDAMYAQVFAYGAYEPAETAVVSSLLREGDFAIDIGANYGWFSVLMGAAVGDAGRVLAVEPMPGMLAELRANIALNPGLPIEIRPVALGESPGMIELHTFEGLAHGHTSASTLGRDDYIVHEAELRTLDELLSAAPASPALIKVDVEGAERAVLAGAASTLAAADPPIWMIEVNQETSGAFGYRPAQLIADLLAAASHDVYRVAAGGLKPESEPEAAAHGATWICVPESRVDRVRGLVAGP